MTARPADPVRPHTTRTEEPEPDATTARRDLLLVLLSRLERGTLRDHERPLFRPLIEAEIAHGQATIDQYAAEAPWLKARAEDEVQTATEGLRDAIAQALEEADYRHDMRRGDLADTVMPVVLRRIEKLAAGRATWKAKAEEIERDRDRLFEELDARLAAARRAKRGVR